MGAIISIVLAYLLGSLSSAVIVCRLSGLADPRAEGSGNPGATNVLRIGGHKAAILTLLGDAAKGFLAIVIGHFFNVEGVLLGVVGLAAFLGHLYPVFFNFKGGKGVATMFGIIFGLSIMGGLLLTILWATIVALTGYASLASIITAITAPVLMIWLDDFGYVLPLLIITALTVWRHHENIQRLLKGKENKTEFKKKK